MHAFVVDIDDGIIQPMGPAQVYYLLFNCKKKVLSKLYFSTLYQPGITEQENISQNCTYEH